MLNRCRPCLAAKMQGTITHWHPFERRGVITTAEGKTFKIPNTRAFETVLSLARGRSLTGATVYFEVAEAGDTDRVIIRQRTEEITAQSYKRAPPLQDYLSHFRVAEEGTEGSSTPQRNAPPVSESADRPDQEGFGHLPWQKKKVKHQGSASAATSSSAGNGPIAINIELDLSTVGEPSEKQKLEDRTRHYLHDGIRPPSHLKDLRSCVILNDEALGSVRRNAAAGGSVVTRRGGEPSMMDSMLQESNTSSTAWQTNVATAQNVTPSSSTVGPSETEHSSLEGTDIVRTMETSPVVGTVVAWSQLHRSGLVLLGELNPDEPLPVVKNVASNAFVIRNVEAFETAMPTSLDLVRKTVRFHATRYSNLPHQSFAERIEIIGALDYSLKTTLDPDDTAAVRKSKKGAPRDPTKAKMVFDECVISSVLGDECSEDVPVGSVYGVITRWSGGQGTIEMGNGKTYFIETAAAFEQLIDQNSSSIRGAVVTFTVDKARPKFVKSVNILSLNAKDIKDMKPLRSLQTGVEGAEGSQSAALVDSYRRQRTQRRRPSVVDDAGSCAAQDSPDLVPLEGFVVAWSPAEETGIIQGNDGERYLLKEASENVIDWDPAVTRDLLRKGRRVQFNKFGGSGLLACNVTLLEAEADEEVLRKAILEKPPTTGLDGNTEEAIPSPLSTSYWMSRVEKAGFDVSEVRNRQKQVVPPELMDDDPMLDSADLFSKDPWYQNKDRNIKVPGTDVRVGDMAHISPSAMMNVAAKVQDPAKLEKLKDKYFNQLTEEMKEHAWKQAKEMAPRYGQRIREAKERGEEPVFHFY